MSEEIYEVVWEEEYGSVSWIDDDEGIVHNHFNCPICNVESARTDMYIEAMENEDKDGDNLFCCSECNANFIFVEFVDYHHDKAKIKFIESENEE